MSIPTSEIIPGVLLPDGTLELAYPSGLSAGPVTISIVHLEPESKGEVVQIKRTVTVRLPDPLTLESENATPFELPRQGSTRPIIPTRGQKRLPDPFDKMENEE